MTHYQYIYGPVPSRRLGLSLGISPIPKKHCNYACTYCQLGRTDHLTNTREIFFDLAAILEEFKTYLKSDTHFDVITIVGEGEPLLYKSLGQLIKAIKKLTNKPVCVITNGALLMSEEVRQDLLDADILLPSLDAYDQDSFKRINRPHGTLTFDEVYQGLVAFSKIFTGQLWIEIMLLEGENDSLDALKQFKALLEKIDYNRLFINTLVRPPAESTVREVSGESLKLAMTILGGTSIEQLASIGFYSDIADDYEAISSIIKRHPMNQYEIAHFLDSRNCDHKEAIFAKLSDDPTVEVVHYKGYKTFRK